MEDKIYSEYCAILAEELQPAMGCTEPIAVAYCAALARKTLGCLPEDVQVYASANIINNMDGVPVIQAAYSDVTELQRVERERDSTYDSIPGG